MTDIYAMPGMNDTDSILHIFRYVGNISGGLYMPVILLAIWFVIFITSLSSGSTRFSSASRAWTFAGFIISVLSIPLAVLNILAPRWMYTAILLFGFGLVWIYLEDSRND